MTNGKEWELLYLIVSITNGDLSIFLWVNMDIGPSFKFKVGVFKGKHRTDVACR